MLMFWYEMIAFNKSGDHNPCDLCKVRGEHTVFDQGGEYVILASM